MFGRIFLCSLAGFATISIHGVNLPPPPLREFRGAWVPSVGNSQWPSKTGLTTAEQKAELIAILNRAQQLQLNAIILQVRPACDALYASKIEPWSEYMTGEMGRAPSPFYDPLEFAITQAHQRGIELHAWVNPFRAHNNLSKSPISANHVSKKYPGMVVTYGKYLWLDPGQKAVHDYSRAVILDILRRYDIDGLHMDDYFYPYLEKDETGKKNLPFPDDGSWKKYQNSGGKMTRADWRRENVNSFIAQTYQSIKAQKPWVKFGVSPFGIWKPGNPPSTSIKSGNMYEEIYCDSLKWWTNGWMDYLSPQLYWPIEPPAQSYTALLQWWAAQNVQHRHLWPGMNTGNAGGKWKAEEIVNQIKATRAQAGAAGHIHWSMKSVMRNNGGVADEVKLLYAQPALVPVSPWLKAAQPAQPVLSVVPLDGGLKVKWNSPREKTFVWIFQERTSTGWKTRIFPENQNLITLSKGGELPLAIALSAVNRSGWQSSPALWEQAK